MSSGTIVTEGGARRPNPYVGPRSIRYGERIYGRDREIEELRDVLIADRIVLMYSPSGAGKSSLIDAGLRPELERRDFWVLPTIRVGLDVEAELGESGVGNRYLLSTLFSLEEGRERQLDPSELATMHLDEYLTRILEEEEEALDPCLVFDQFEELLTLDPTDQNDKASFMAEVSHRASESELVGTVLDARRLRRSTRPLSQVHVHTVQDRDTASTCSIPRQRSSQTRLPAEDAGVSFSEQAAARLVDDLRRVKVQRGAAVTEELGPYVEPVQLQVVCRQLWNRLEI